MPRAHLFGHEAHDQRVRGVEADAKGIRRRLPVAQHGPHHRGLVRGVGSAQKVAQLVYKDLQPLRLADLAGRFANENVRGQRTVRSAKVHLVADPFVVRRETNGHPRRGGPHFQRKFHERPIERADGRVRDPVAHRDDLKPHATMVLEDIGGLAQTLADALFPKGLDVRVGGIGENRHGDLVNFVRGLSLPRPRGLGGALPRACAGASALPSTPGNLRWTNSGMPLRMPK